MKKAKCHKEVLFRPMTRGQYNLYQGWTIPEDQNGNDDGYLVEYVDGGKPNHPDHNGYISWSPKEQFDNGYSEIDKMTNDIGIVKYFSYAHLPENLQHVSKSAHDLAIEMNKLPDGPEKSAGLRKLLEAKDCFVRASI